MSEKVKERMLRVESKTRNTSLKHKIYFKTKISILKPKFLPYNYF